MSPPIPAIVLETERLILRELAETDAPFILRLLNEPSFIENIVDKGVRTIEQARKYINSGPVTSYRKNGFGSYLIALKDAKTAIGLCGLVKRDSLEFPDIGYALLPEYWSNGYAVESASALLKYAQENLGLIKVVGITDPENEVSARILEKIGFRFEKMIQISENMPDKKYYVSK